MPHTQHSVSETSETLTCTSDMSLIAVRIPAKLNWALKAIAAARETTRTRLLVQVIEEFVAQHQRAEA